MAFSMGTVIPASGCICNDLWRLAFSPNASYGHADAQTNKATRIPAGHFADNRLKPTNVVQNWVGYFDFCFFLSYGDCFVVQSKSESFKALMSQPDSEIGNQKENGIISLSYRAP